MTRTLKPNRRISKQNGNTVAPSHRNSLTSFTAVSIATWLALLVTVTTLCLTLLGYGYDLAYLDAVGLRPEELQRTPLDFLLRSWRPLVHLLARLNRFNEWEFRNALWVEVWWKTWWLLSLPVFTAFIAWCVANKPWRWLRMPRWLRWPDSLKHVPAYLQSQRKKIATKWPRWWANPLRHWGYMGWLVWPVFLCVIFFLIAVIWFVIGFGAVTVSYIPMIGIPSGIATAQQQVLSPIGCLGRPSKKNDDAERLARCVRVKRDGIELARGYLVDYGAGRVFLYQPCTKQSISLSLERTTIEQVSTLEFAAPGKDCHTHFIAPIFNNQDSR